MFYVGSKKMNNHQNQKNGNFFASDNAGHTVVIEWHMTNILAPELAKFKREVSDLAAEVTAKTETQFLKQFPDAISSGGFLKSCETLFAEGADQVDWDAAEQRLQETIKQFYFADLTKFGQEIINKLINDVYFFALVKDQTTSQLLGFIMSAITPALSEGDIKLINLVVFSKSQGIGLEKILLGSLIRALPEVRRIFTMVRPANTYALQTLHICGFIEDKDPVQDPHHPINTEYLVVLECRVDQSEVLQKAAERLSQ